MVNLALAGLLTEPKDGLRRALSDKSLSSARSEEVEKILEPGGGRIAVVKEDRSLEVERRYGQGRKRMAGDSLKG